MAFLNLHNCFIVKPIDEWQGNGVEKRTIDKERISNIINDYLGKNILLEQVIKQHSQMCFGNQSVNSIRIFSVISKSGEVVLLKALLRVGVGNAIVDNFCNGGVMYPININYGVVEGYGIDHNGNKYIYHPNFESCMLGFIIPNWELIKSSISKLAYKVPECRYIGWDIAVTQDGFEVIEGNHNPDHEMLELVGFDNKFYNKIVQLK